MSTIVVQPGQDHPPLQAEFQRLSDAIAGQRAKLQNWQQANSDFQQRLAAATAPHLARLRAIDRDLLVWLDHAAHHADLGRSDLRILHGLARGLAAHLLRGGEDAELQALYQRYQDESGDQDADAREDDAGEHTATPQPTAPPAGTPAAEDDWMAQWESMESAQADDAEARQRQREQHKAQARRQRRTAAPSPTPEEGSQTLRAVYRKLASALHPDREPDPAERERKNTLMQRVNRAYAAQNLLDLLQLQLETAQIGTGAVAAMGEDALRRYNAVLAEQLDELRQETADTERAYRQSLGLGFGAEATAARIVRAVKEQVRALQQEIAYYEWELGELRDPRVLKQWLREQRG